MTVLFHYTCRHSAKGIASDGLVVPHHQPMLGDAELAWFTDMAPPDAHALGLTSTIITCDRTERSFAVMSVAHVEPWRAWRDRQRRTLAFTRACSALEFGRPTGRWYVATSAVPVEPIGRRS